MNTKSSRILREIFSYTIITLGTAILALGIQVFWVPLKLAPGGFSGLATIIYHLWGWPMEWTSLGMNIPFFLLGVTLLGRSFGAKTIYATVLFSLFLGFGALIPPVTHDLVLGAVFGGLVVGLGGGLVLRQNGTTGGTELAASLAHKFLPWITLGQLILMIDALVLGLSMIAFQNWEVGLYGAVAIFVVTKVVDFLIEGPHFAKAAFIISDRAQDISEGILRGLNRGVTGLKGQGMFTGKDKNVLLCVVSQREIPGLKRLVLEKDPLAFVIVTDVNEVVGEGFLRKG